MQGKKVTRKRRNRRGIQKDEEVIRAPGPITVTALGVENRRPVPENPDRISTRRFLTPLQHHAPGTPGSDGRIPITSHQTPRARGANKLLRDQTRPSHDYARVFRHYEKHRRRMKTDN